MKYREGLTVAITNTLILLTVLAVLGVSLNPVSYTHLTSHLR